jgi:hypothetical protein
VAKKTGKQALSNTGRAFASPVTVTLPPMLADGRDVAFRETVYLMVLAFGRLHACREAFGRALSLTASQFIVLIGTAYRQGAEGVTIRALADHTQLAATHVTTEVGRLIGKGLLTKEALLRRVNDQLFKDVSRSEFAVVSRFLAKFAHNSEDALIEIQRAERERATADRLARTARQD